MVCGVGQPAPTHAAVQRTLFGRQARAAGQTKEVRETSGPGAYVIPSQLGRQVLSTRPTSPMASLSSRIHRIAQSADCQGPGVCRRDSFFDHHWSPNKKWAPRHSFGVKSKPGMVADTPGPGSHLDQTSSFPNKRKSPAFTFSGRLDVPNKSASDVGPGRCREDSSLGTQKVSTQKNYPAFSFGHRLDPKVSLQNISPGPGAYG